MVRVSAEGDLSCLGDAARILSSGGVVCYPTDSTYALGVNARDRGAINRLMAMKGRDAHKPISIAVANLDQLFKETHNNQRMRTTLRKLLPGAVTVILKPVNVYAPPIANAEGFVGFRVPDDEVCRLLMSKLDFPITATSANPGGQPAALDVQMLMDQPQAFLAQIDLVIDGGTTRLRKASTVLSLSEAGEIEIIRQGALSSAQISELISDDRL